jgi:hypothetical protein
MTCALRASLANVAAGVPQGHGQAAEQSRGPLALGRGGVRTLQGAARSDPCGAPPPAPVLAWSRGDEALLLARRAGHHALSKGGARLEARGRRAFLQAGLTRALRHDDRRGQSRAGLLAAHGHRVVGTSALQALAG